MTFHHDQFTMGFRPALDVGIDYRDFKKVHCLPSEVEFTAVAGVWGDYSNIRCLFMDADGNKYMRNIQRWRDKGYLIKELGLDAKDIEVGQKFLINSLD